MTVESNRTWRLRTLAIAILLITFAAGALTGAAFERVRGPEAGEMGPRGPRGGPRPDMFAPESPLGRRLQLAPTQADSIQKIIERDRARADTLFRQIRPRLRARFDSTMAAVEAVLTPERRAEFARFREERRAQRRRGPRGDREPGPAPFAPPPQH